MVRFLSLLFALSLAGCYVNRAVIDPWSYAPMSPECYWLADSKAGNLACKETVSDVELPCEEYVLSLAEVLDIALVNNTATQSTWAQAREAAAQYGQSQSTAFPQIIGNFYYSRFRTAYLSNQGAPGLTLTNIPAQFNQFIPQIQATADSLTQPGLIITLQSQWGPQANLSYTIFDFGQRRLTSEAARYSLYFADYTHNRAIQSLMETITLDYYNYLYAIKLLEAKEADLANAQETLDSADLGLQKGVHNVSDVLQARTQALLAEIQLSEQRKAVNTAYATLLDDMGLPATSFIKVQKLPLVDPESVTLDPVEDFLNTAFHCRPDLLAARANVRSAEKSLKAAKREWLPKLDYNLNFGRTYFSGGFNDNYDYTSTFTLTMPIFTGFHIRNDIKLAQAKLEGAEASARQTELDVIKDVTTAHYNIGVAFDTLKASNRFLKAAAEQYKVAILQYRAGVNTILDVVSAQSSLFDARAQQAQATQEWFTALATLTYSAGIISYNIEGKGIEVNR